MKVNPGYMLQVIAGNPVIVPLGNQFQKRPGLYRINDEAAFLFEQLQAGAPDGEVIEAFAARFGSTPAESGAVFTDFVDKLQRLGIIGEPDACSR
ncbi:MAG: PqqD family protein [Clostridiales bacterium]|nr:PqqD family protein [Clostridiales bacterium]